MSSSSYQQQESLGRNDSSNLTGREDSGEPRDSTFSCEMHFKDKLFLFSFDLLDLNTFYNYFIYSLFMIFDFVFLAYFPLNHLYNDFVVRTHVYQMQTSADGSNFLNDTVVSSQVLYDKSFDTENTDGFIKKVVQYFNIQFILKDM